MTPEDLVIRWRNDADLLEIYGDVRGAAAARLHAQQLEEALRAQANELLTPNEAERASGYSKRRLRELEAEGKLRNHGRKGSPRFRRSELPRKAVAARAPGFDPVAEAMAILSPRFRAPMEGTQPPVTS